MQEYKPDETSILKVSYFFPNSKQIEWWRQKKPHPQILSYSENTLLPILFWSEMSSSGSTKGLSSSSSCPALIHLSFIICYKRKSFVSTTHLPGKKMSCWKKHSPIHQTLRPFLIFLFPNRPPHLPSFCFSPVRRISYAHQASCFPVSCIPAHSWELKARNTDQEQPDNPAKSSRSKLDYRSPWKPVLFWPFSSMTVQTAGKRQLHHNLAVNTCSSHHKMWKMPWWIIC